MRIGLLGDSQAEGLAPHLRRLLGDQLVLVDARRGVGTRAFIDDAMPVAPQHVDLAIVVLGGNDSASSSYTRTLEAAVHAIGTMASAIVWIGPSASENREVAARHDSVRQVQTVQLPRLGVTFLDPRAWQVGAAGAHAPDGTHFTRAAYELQAQAIVQRIRFRPPWGWIAAGVTVAVGLGVALAR